MFFKKLRHDEAALVFENGKLTRVLKEGYQFVPNLFGKKKIEILQLRDAVVKSDNFDLIYESPLVNEFVSRHEVKDRERALVFRNGKLDRILTEGKYLFLTPYSEEEVDVVSLRTVMFTHEKFDAVFESDLINQYAERVELSDSERALVWVDNRFYGAFSGGKYLFMKCCSSVRIERADASEVRFTHADETAVLRHGSAAELLEICRIPSESVGVWYHSGKRRELLEPGTYSFWKGTGTIKVHQVDMREKVLDIQGQDIMTADRVTLRLNVLVSYAVSDPVRYVESTEETEQAVYRESQLAVREMVGRTELDSLLISKETLSTVVFDRLKVRAEQFGVKITTVGIRDIILPGEMKTLLNKVMEAKKAAEANLITRREESAALRSQMNSAKMIEDNPILMRLRELEILESIASKTQLQVLVGDGKGLREQVLKLI